MGLWPDSNATAYAHVGRAGAGGDRSCFSKTPAWRMGNNVFFTSCGAGGNALGMLPAPGPWAPPATYAQCPRHRPQVAPPPDTRLVRCWEQGPSQLQMKVRGFKVKCRAGRGLSCKSVPATVCHRTPAVLENGVLCTNTLETPDAWFGTDLVSITGRRLCDVLWRELCFPD